MSKPIRRLTSLALAGLLLLPALPSFAAAADPQTFDLDKVVITATKTEKKVMDVPASVTVITAADLQKQNIRTLDDALQTIPGVYIKGQRGMKATKISIRGLSQNRVLVLSDGMPLNNGYTGGVQWANIPIDNIQRIEVIRGPISALYGSSAMGGVINIITKENAPAETSLSLGAGSQGTRSTTFHHNNVAGKLEYYLDFSRDETDGYIINPAQANQGKFGSDNTQYNLKLVYHFNDTDKIIINKGRADYRYKFETATDRAERLTETTSVQYKARIDPDKELQIRWSELNFSDYWTITGTNFSPNPTKTYEGEINLNWQVNKQHNLTMGFDSKVDSCDGKTYRLSNPAVISYNNLLESSGGKTLTRSVYLQDEMTLSNKTTFVLSGRYDQWKFYNGYNPSGSLPEKNANQFSPKAAFLFKVNEQTSWYLSAGKSFVSPTIFNLARRWDTTNTLLLPNPDLQPETSTSYELGVNHRFNPATAVKVAIFRNNVENIIYQGFNRKLSATKEELQWKNAGQAEITGLEIEVDHRFSPQWSGFVNYTHNNPTITANSDPTLIGKQVPTVPKDAFNIGLTYEKEKWTANLQGRYVSRTYESDKNTEPTSGFGSFQPYFVVDTKFNYRCDKNTTLSLSISNLFDRQYYQESLSPGRTTMLEVRQKF